MKYSKVIILATTLVLTATAVRVLAQADFAIGAIIRGLELPQRDKDGVIKMKIFGREATVMSLSRIKVRGLIIDFYNKGLTETKISSDESDYWREENRLTSSNNVKIEHPSFTLTAKTMDWLIMENKGIFQENVKVVIKRNDEVLPK
ncbi:MAG: hypothetical protein SH807_01190 [Blastochloris sp.]|mgnify:CR=1 FL=1|nr:hypothetical protein [Blastochloris sp.]